MSKPQMPIAPSTTRNMTETNWKAAILISQGLTNKEIAEAMGTTVHVIKNYLREIYDKAGCWNRTELALWYVNITEVKKLSREKYNASIKSKKVKVA